MVSYISGAESGSDINHIFGIVAAKAKDAVLVKVNQFYARIRYGAVRKTENVCIKDVGIADILVCIIVDTNSYSFQGIVKPGMEIPCHGECMRGKQGKEERNQTACFQSMAGFVCFTKLSIIICFFFKKN